MRFLRNMRDNAKYFYPMFIVYYLANVFGLMILLYHLKMAKIQRLKKKRRQEEQLQERIESQTSMQTHMILYKILTEIIEKIELLSGT